MRITMPERKENAIEKRTQMTLDHDNQDEVLTRHSLPRVTRSQAKRPHNLCKIFLQLASMNRQCFDKLLVLKQFYNTYCKHKLKTFLFIWFALSVGKVVFSLHFLQSHFCLSH